MVDSLKNPGHANKRLISSTKHFQKLKADFLECFKSNFSIKECMRKNKMNTEDNVKILNAFTNIGYFILPRIVFSQVLLYLI